MLTTVEKLRLEQSLKNCKTLEEMLSIITTQYDASKCEPGFLTKPKIIEGLVQAVNILNPPKKK